MTDAEKGYLDNITEAIYQILNGKDTQHLKLPEDYPNNEIRQVTSYLNKLISEYNEFSQAMQLLSEGELKNYISSGKLSIQQSFKTLQSNLRHLTWKTQQISNGDFTQQIDFMGDFSTAFNSMANQLKDAFEKIESQNKELKVANEIIEQEKAKSDKLLLNILPIKVVNDLKTTGISKPETFNNVTVFFSDIVGFTKLSANIEPSLLINELNKIFTAFDDIIGKNHCERIKTIGDAYLAVCGMPEKNNNHAEHIVKSAIEIIHYLDYKNNNSKIKWQVRIGIHTGKVVGSVVGIKKYIYDVFGDTINTTSRMESNSNPMKINISESTFNLVKDKFTFIEREPIEIKGKGKLKMYFVKVT